MASPSASAKRIAEAFGWAKTVAGLRKLWHRGLPKVDWQFTLAMAAYNLVRLAKLLVNPGGMISACAAIPSPPRSLIPILPDQMPLRTANHPLKSSLQPSRVEFCCCFSRLLPACSARDSSS
jgi:hypothetical protein